MNRLIVIVAFLGTTLASAATALAGPYETHFGKPSKGMVCYARDYSRDELDANPAQRLDGLRILFGPTTQLGKKNTAKKFDLAVGLSLKGSKSWASGVAYCSTKGNEFHCSIEGDGGQFRLKGSGRTGLRLHTSGITIEGGDDFVEIGATSLGYLTSRVGNDVCRKAGVKVR